MSYSDDFLAYRELEAIASASRARTEQMQFIEETEIGSRVSSPPALVPTVTRDEFYKDRYFRRLAIKKNNTHERGEITRKLAKPASMGGDWRPYTNKLFGGTA